MEMSENATSEKKNALQRAYTCPICTHIQVFNIAKKCWTSEYHLSIKLL